MPAINITDSSRSDIVVDFNDAPVISYASLLFSEDVTNIGQTSTSIVVTLTNDTFAGADGDDFIVGGQVVATNVPSGLTAVATRDSATQITFTLTGNATVHEDADDIANLTFSFEDAAFANVAAVNVTDSTVSNLSVDYLDAYTCLLYTSPSPRDATLSRMPSSA